MRFLAFVPHFLTLLTLLHTVHTPQSYLGEEEEAQEQMERWQAEQTFSPFVSRYALECFGRIRMVANARDATQVGRCGRYGSCGQGEPAQGMPHRCGSVRGVDGSIVSRAQVHD